MQKPQNTPGEMPLWLVVNWIVSYSWPVNSVCVSLTFSAFALKFNPLGSVDGTVKPSVRATLEESRLPKYRQV
jgi:hypothetical protein